MRDMRTRRCDEMDLFGKEIGDEADVTRRTVSAEIAFARDRFGDDVGLRKPAVGAARVDVADIGDRSLARTHGGDEARRSAGARRIAARDPRRMADDAGDGLADGEIGAARGACGEDEGDAGGGRLRRAEIRDREACKRDDACEEGSGDGGDHAFHGAIEHTLCVNISMRSGPLFPRNHGKMLKRLLSPERACWQGRFLVPRGFHGPLFRAHCRRRFLRRLGGRMRLDGIGQGQRADRRRHARHSAPKRRHGRGSAGHARRRNRPGAQPSRRRFL